MGFSSSLSIVVLEVVARLSEDLLEHAADVGVRHRLVLADRKAQPLHRFFAPLHKLREVGLNGPCPLVGREEVVVHPLQKLSPLVRVQVQRRRQLRHQRELVDLGEHIDHGVGQNPQVALRDADLGLGQRLALFQRFRQPQWGFCGYVVVVPGRDLGGLQVAHAHGPLARAAHATPVPVLEPSDGGDGGGRVGPIQRISRLHRDPLLPHKVLSLHVDLLLQQPDLAAHDVRLPGDPARNFHHNVPDRGPLLRRRCEHPPHQALELVRVPRHFLARRDLRVELSLYDLLRNVEDV
mmetsp:Transcript_4265/g.12917  ORF Transcript_4265/g.12917 Transcript_4265/m.12917 type:complete len:294 (-) Transcript_4265:1776-2657(-)